MDPFELERFVEAQEDVHERALAEIRAGRKQTHWMWFVFPQVRGLGSSPMALRYAIGSLDEARAYLAHPVLGPRLLACAEAALAATDRTAHDIFGPPDDVKLRSSATLFERAGGPDVFARLLDRFFAGERDPATLERL
jgi:uncharacterized protein (DUF1810 family)